MRSLVLTLVVLAAVPAYAQFVDENLLLRIPQGYKTDYQAKNATEEINEMVPQGETVQNWTEMVTVQIFSNLKNVDPKQMRDGVAKGWLETCTNGGNHQVADTTENGYSTLVWQLSCPKNPETGKPEWTWFKAIRGNDSLYVVQKAFRFEPSREQITTWVQYLRGVTVCD